ncbi:MAG: hypothetical protein KatS3mg107_1180 [Gemmataceae bacterium]|nr:MAG: hypothetical protein KatS3mg107_1180 [Gemmataceae bacterium]
MILCHTYFDAEQLGALSLVLLAKGVVQCSYKTAHIVPSVC